MQITETQRDYEVMFPFDYNKLQAVKAIPGARFHSNTKTWHIPKYRSMDVERLIVKYGATKLTSQVVPDAGVYDEIPPLPELDIAIPLKRPLYNFQRNGTAYCIQNKRVIIGDQPGLGKTAQLIAAVEALNAFPCLIICPSTLKLNWQREWIDVSGRRSMILSDRIRNSWQQYHRVGMIDVFIVNYESLKKYFVRPGWSKPKEGQFKMNQIPFLDNINIFKSIAIDESHKCKDGGTQQTKMVMGICKGKEYVFELTGTPLVNRPKDLIPQLHIIDRLKDVVSHIPQPIDRHGKPADFSGYKRFIDRYCDGGMGASHLKELNYRLNKFCFYRREKSEVLKDLPAKVRQVVLCEISNRQEYHKAENDFVNYLKEVKGCTDAEIKKKLKGEIMVRMGILKQISARGKMNEVKDYVDEIVDAGEKIVVFCSLREIGDKTKELFPKAVMIRGGMNDQEKDHSIRSFQTNPDVKIIICSIKAAGVGITLTASSRVAFIEFPWTFADCEQCEDRTHRIGQQDSVQCAYFLGENTIDRYCYDIIQRKKDMAITVTGATDDVEEEEIDKLLTLFNQK